jgi:hypothetical protein
VADIIRTFDEDIPVPAAEAAQREAVAWAMTHSLADQFPGDQAASVELAHACPPKARPSRRPSTPRS